MKTLVTVNGVILNEAQVAELVRSLRKAKAFDAQTVEFDEKLAKKAVARARLQDKLIGLLTTTDTRLS